MTGHEIDALWQRLDGASPGELVALLGAPHEGEPVAVRTLRGLALLRAGQAQESAAELRRVLEAEPQNPVANAYLVLADFRCGDRSAAGKRLLAMRPFPHAGFLEDFLRTFWPLRFSDSLGAQMPEPRVPIEDPRDGDFQRWRTMQAQIDPASLELDDMGLLRRMRTQIAMYTTPGGALRRCALKLSARYQAEAAEEFIGLQLALADPARRDAAVIERRSAVARMMFSRAHAIRPLNEEIAANCAWVNLHARRLDAAAAAIEPLVARAADNWSAGGARALPPNPDLLVCYAWLLHEQQRHADALKVISAVVPEGPYDFCAHFVAAVSHLMLGNEEEFEATFRLATTTYFIDTWEQMLCPFLTDVGWWLAQ